MRGKVLSIACLLLATVSGMSLWFMTAAILPDIARDSGVADTDLAALSSAVQAGFVSGALAIAMTGLADRVDPRKVFAICAVGTAVANLALLAVPVDGPAAIIVRFVTGALMAGVYPIGMKIAVGWGLSDRGLLVGMVVGALTAGKSLPYLLAWLGGADWRLVLVSGSAVASLGGGLVLLAGLGAPPCACRELQARGGLPRLDGSQDPRRLSGIPGPHVGTVRAVGVGRDRGGGFLRGKPGRPLGRKPR